MNLRNKHLNNIDSWHTYLFTLKNVRDCALSILNMLHKCAIIVLEGDTSRYFSLSPQRASANLHVALSINSLNPYVYDLCFSSMFVPMFLL